MNKTIKIIDLINKIANGEEFPKKIKYNKKDIYIWDSIQNKYVLKDASYISLAFDFKELNEEVEIIEDDYTIDIQGIEELDVDNIHLMTAHNLETLFVERYNEMVKVIKQTDKEIKEMKKNG